MARDRIEKMAIGYLANVILKSKYAMPYISENDKTPSFDGELLLYSTEDHVKDKMEGRISVQVKGITVDVFTGKCTYPFAWADLENYYKDKGCLFFVVQILKSDDEQYRIYYKEWPLLELQKVLQKNPAPREHETTSLPLKGFPVEKDAIDSLLFSFLNDMRKQMVVSGTTKLPTLEEFDGSQFEIQLSAFGNEKLKPLQVLTREARYIYKLTPYGKLPVAEGKVKISLDAEQDLKVTVNGVSYYDICSATYKEGKEIHRIGDSLEFEIADNKLTYHLELSNSLNQRLYDMKFLFAAIEYGSFEIAEHFRFDLGGLLDEEGQITQWREHYGDLEFFKRFLDELGVKDDLRLDQLKAEDEERLNDLGNGVLCEELYLSKERKSTFCVTPIGNLQIVLVYEENGHTEDGYLYKLHSIKDVKLEITLETEAHEVVEVPFISYIRHEKPELLGVISNLDWEQLVNEYARLVDKQPTFYIEIATLDMLAIINQYDKTGKSALLRNALRIQEWLAKECRDKLVKQSMTLNRMQIVRRMRNLTDNERGELAKVIAITKFPQIKYGAYLLLDEMANAKYWYARLTTDEQKEIDGQPISKFRRF